MSASSKKKLRKENNAAQITEKQLNEQKEAKKLKTYTLTFVVVMVLVVVLALGTLAVTAYMTSGILERGTDAVTIGEHTLTNADLNYFYIDTINETYSDWYSQYGDYTDMYMSWVFGLDVTTPLNEQMYDEEKTFADYFTDLAVADAKSTYAIYDEAMAKGHTLTDEEKSDVDDTMKSMETYATLYGYSNFKDYLKGVYGHGAEEETFRNYLDVLAMVQSYQTYYHDSLTYDADALSTYNDTHFNDFSSFSYASFHVDSNDFLTGGTEDEDGNITYSDEEKAAALKAAEEAAKSIVASAADTVEKLNTAIAEHEAYKDDSSAESTETEDAIYTGISDEIAEWLADNSRKAGDLGYMADTVTTTDEEGNETTKTNGYYVVLFLERNDNNNNLVNVRHILTKFAGGTTNDDGETVYSDDEKKAAYDKLVALRDEWLAGEATEESFAALATEKSDDTGSTKNGGLYEDICPGEMVEEFNDWIFDASRKTGDYEIVESPYGYHLIYFVSTDEVTYRNHMIEETLREDDYEAWYNGIVDAAKVTVLDTSRLELDLVMSNG